MLDGGWVHGRLKITRKFFNEWIRIFMQSLIKQRFKGYCCKSDMPLYKWEVTSNYFYSPFNMKNFLIFELRGINKCNNLVIWNSHTSINKAESQQQIMNTENWWSDEEPSVASSFLQFLKRCHVLLCVLIQNLYILFDKKIGWLNILFLPYTI